MHIILVSDRLSKSRSLTLSTGQLLLAALAAGVAVLVIASALFWLSARYAAEVRLPFLHDMLVSAQAEESRRSETYLRQNLNAMAIKLGELQAQLMRLDALGERLSALSGVKPPEIRPGETPGRGGALSSSQPPSDMSMEDLTRELNALSRRMDNRNDYLGALESRLFDDKMKKKLLPTIQPVAGSWNASSFGWRIDPITGQQALHEGVDFIAPVGTTINAAAGGVVIAAETHPQYGLMVEIDHGNDFITRYAHASKLLVKVGDLVKRGVKIAEVGNSGRSTGPHLHFEVRFKGVAQNPTRFLQNAALASRK